MLKDTEPSSKGPKGPICTFILFKKYHFVGGYTSFQLLEKEILVFISLKVALLNKNISSLLTSHCHLTFTLKAFEFLFYI